MTADAAGLAEAVAARVCHDLSGLTGTLMNTLEMASEEVGPKDGGGAALAIAAEAGQALGGRLRLFRAAWGGTGGERDAAALAALLEHAAGYPRLRTDWLGCTGGPFAPEMARLLLNVALAGVESLKRAGVVRFSGAAEGDIAVVLDGPDAAWPAALTDPVRAGPVEPRQVQPVLTALFARADGIGVAWEPSAPAVLILRP